MADFPLSVGHILDFQELKKGTKAEIPDRFVRDVNQRPLPTIPSHFSSSIPVIDLSKLMDGKNEEFHDEMLKFTASCEEWGFFQVINHGIDLDLLDKMEKLAMEFFMLPFEEKQKYSMGPGTGQGFGQAFVFSEDQKLDWDNMYALGIAPDYIRDPKVWTTNPPAFGKTLDAYSLKIAKLFKELLRFVALSLGLNENTFEEMFGAECIQFVGMNYYPPCPRPDLVMGLSPHSDGSALTLLQQRKDSSVGLQILKNETWVPVQLVPNALVVNIGDTIEVLTNGRYKSVEHRAVTHKDNDRLTLVTFYTPSRDTNIAPMPEMVDEDNPAMYRKYRQEDYGKHYASSRLQGKKSLDFAKILP